jgi:poly(hydroxyalkanoate) granule-associated protein
MKDHREIGKDLMHGGRNVWLAGLGAVAAIDDNRRTRFESLVTRGRQREQRQREALDAVRNQATDRIRGLSEQINSGVQSTMSSTLHRIGVPTRDEIQGLIDHVEKLTSKLEDLQR